MNYPQCEDCALSASFLRECSDVSYVAGERSVWSNTVHKEIVVVEEIKEVELRSFLRNLFMTEIIIETRNFMKSNNDDNNNNDTSFI